ncbi:Uncharacterised protein [Salmonella enterica subsp. enterica]|nr:Uncharacterised protein [Salmonella enterica subsp. enterica]
MAHQLFGDDTGRAGFIALFLKDFFISLFFAFGSIP